MGILSRKRGPHGLTLFRLSYGVFGWKEMLISNKTSKLVHWKDISKFMEIMERHSERAPLLLCIWSVVSLGKGKIRIFGKIIRQGRDICFLTCIICHLLKTILLPGFKCGLGALVLFPLGFITLFSDREAMDMAALLSLLKSHSFSRGRRRCQILEP